MKTLETNLSGSSQHDPQKAANAGTTGEATWIRRGPLTPEELTEQKKRLDALAEISDDDIDFSDIPPMTDEQMANMVRGPWTDRVMRTITLKIDDEVAEWLQENAVRKSHLINLVLKREAQRDKRRKAEQAKLDKAS
jgi:uncharacterized protein (DUF4415 family)